MAIIVLDSVDKSFGRFKAVDRVSLEIADGEFFTLLGPSGCGKTSTLRLIAGLEFPDAGKIEIGGRDVSRVSPAQRRIAMVFQNYALYPHLTIFENIAYPLKIRKMAAAEIKQKVESVAARLHLDRVLDRMPSAVSGGQQQRAAVARAMVQEPVAYLFDEPLSNLDARLRLESRRFLKSILRETHGTAVYVTHDQTEAMALSDRVAVMKDGKLVQVAPPAELYDRPASTFVAGFVGNLPMNLIEGEIIRDSGLIFRSGDFRLSLPSSLELEPPVKATLGIRPEEIGIGDHLPLPARVLDLESQGSEKIAAVQVSGIELFIRVIGNPGLAQGASTSLEINPTGIHVFGEDGRRIGK